MGVAPKWVKSKRQREKKKERKLLNDGNNNDQAIHSFIPGQMCLGTFYINKSMELVQ